MGRKDKNRGAEQDGDVTQSQAASERNDDDAAGHTDAAVGGMEEPGVQEPVPDAMTTPDAAPDAAPSADDATPASAEASDVIGYVAAAFDPVVGVPTVGTKPVEYATEQELLDELAILTLDPRHTYLPALRARVEDALRTHDAEVKRLDRMLGDAHAALRKGNDYIHTTIQPRLDAIKARLVKPE